MQVDWFTVGAQIVNFLILVYLLKRFLYGPVVAAMDRREKRVTDRLREADERSEQAEERAAELRRRQEELDARREKLLGEAREEAEARRKALVDEVRGEVDETRRRFMQEVEREKSVFLRELRSQAAGFATAAVRRALRDLAGADLEERVVAVFLERLRKLPSQERGRLADVIRAASEPLRVVTTFELSETQREAVRETLAEEVGEEIALRFAESADLVCGIELRTPGTALAWSLDAFVSDLEENLEETLASRSPASSEAGERAGEAGGEAPADVEREAGEEPCA